MKRGIRLAAITVSFAGLLSSAPAVHAASPRWSAVGAATFVGDHAHASFAAHSDVGGANPSGYVTNRNRNGVQMNGHVTCLRLFGDGQATIGFVVDKAEPASLIGRTEYVFLRDSELGDGINRGGGFGMDPSDCPLFPHYGPLKGNVTINGEA